jgi:hypothetical protein
MSVAVKLVAYQQASHISDVCNKSVQEVRFQPDRSFSVVEQQTKRSNFSILLLREFPFEEVAMINGLCTSTCRCCLLFSRQRCIRNTIMSDDRIVWHDMCNVKHMLEPILQFAKKLYVFDIRAVLQASVSVDPGRGKQGIFDFSLGLGNSNIYSCAMWKICEGNVMLPLKYQLDTVQISSNIVIFKGEFFSYKTEKLVTMSGRLGPNKKTINLPSAFTHFYSKLH